MYLVKKKKALATITETYSKTITQCMDLLNYIRAELQVAQPRLL